MTRIGKSDQGGCSASTRNNSTSPPAMASSGSRSTPAPCFNSRTIAAIDGTESTAMPVLASIWRVMTPSLGVGGSTNTRRSRTARAWSVTRGPLMHLLAVAFVDGDAGQHATELAKGFADKDPTVVEFEFANRPLMFAAALFHDRQRLADFAARLEVANQ